MGIQQYEIKMLISVRHEYCCPVPTLGVPLSHTHKI
jgi:hypothetical protein